MLIQHQNALVAIGMKMFPILLYFVPTSNAKDNNFFEISPKLLKGHVNLEIFGLVHLNHAAGFLHANSGVKMS